MPLHALSDNIPLHALSDNTPLYPISDSIYDNTHIGQALAQKSPIQCNQCNQTIKSDMYQRSSIHVSIFDFNL